MTVAPSSQNVRVIFHNIFQRSYISTSIMSGHAEREMDVTNSGRGIWLVKVPKFLRERWSENTGEADVGTLKIVKQPGQKSTSIMFSIPEEVAREHELPREHRFITHDIKQSLGVFSLPRAPEPVEGEDDVDMKPPVGPSSGVSLEGQVIRKFECQPVMDENYLKLKQKTQRLAATPARKAIPLDRPAIIYKPKSHHEHKVVQEKQKEAEGKKARENKDQVNEMLFAAFEKHQYYNIKDLQKLTRQPITYLKEILKEICNYNVKNPHKNTWELKQEYRHYKQKVVEPVESADSDD